MASADLLLHPVRLRIVQAFLGDRALTTAQLAAELGDVPHASLYRHVSLLAKAGVLHVVAERRVRAVVEHTLIFFLDGVGGATVCPASRRRRADSYPMPLLAPVMSVTVMCS